MAVSPSLGELGLGMGALALLAWIVGRLIDTNASRRQSQADSLTLKDALGVIQRNTATNVELVQVIKSQTRAMENQTRAMENLVSVIHNMAGRLER